MNGTKAVVALMAIAMAVPAAARADWPMYGHDLSNTRNAGGEGPARPEIASLKKAWEFKASEGDFTGTPAVAGGVVVAGNHGGKVYGLDAVTGKQLWSHDVGAPVNGSAAIDLAAHGGPAAYVPVAQPDAPHLVAFSLRDGAKRWDTVLTKQAGSSMYGSPAIWNGTIFVGTSGNNTDDSTARGSMLAIDGASGAIRWQTYTVPPDRDGAAVWSTPAIDTATGRLYVGTGNNYHEPATETGDAILAMDAGTGAILGHFQATPGDTFSGGDNPAGGPDHDFGASPNLFTGADGRALVGDGQKSGVYWALERASLRPAWSTTVGPGGPLGGILGSTALDGERIYGADTIAGQVFGIGRDGTIAWQSGEGGGAHLAPTMVANGVVYTVDPGGTLMARDPATGDTLAKLPLGSSSFGGVSADGGALYVAVGTGPPPEPAPQSNNAGSIIAFGDTSRSGAKPAARPARPRARIQLSVAPRKVAAGKRVRFRLRTTVRGTSRPVRRANIWFAGRHVRTNQRGRAVLRLRLRKGLHSVRATRRGFGATRENVQAGDGPGARTPVASEKPLKFEGSCKFHGTVTFTPPLKSEPQDLDQAVTAPGTCSGTLTDRAGRAREVKDIAATFAENSHAPGASCAGGTAEGAGSLTFPDGKLLFAFSERRAGALATATATGAAGGSASGFGGPPPGPDAPNTVAQCGGDGIKQVELDLQMQTDSGGISG